MKKLAVIVPAYNARNTIEKSLLSVVTQTAVEDVTIYIINDGGQETYEDIVEKFKAWVDIVLINLEKNVGAGFARQVALDMIETPYFTFLDSDDQFVDSLYLKGALDYLQNQANLKILETPFLRENENKLILANLHQSGVIASKIIDTAFIKENDIMFSGLKHGEDLEFYLKLRFAAQPHQVAFLKDKKPYLYKYNPNSITKNNLEQTAVERILSFIKVLENTIQQFGVPKQHIPQVIGLWFSLFANYNYVYDFIQSKPSLKKQVITALQKLYYDTIQDHVMYLKDAELAKFYQSGMYLETGIPEIKITYKDFIKLIEE